eukprot:CAMPEP_0183740316 /NCGR_PEP_ID=MMETSP0737-20130205/59275_1 /TAXON_ID=385413 /ORGANISM="Thalassiosira miniscula, Strain CCMP1093" /LENGTH=98 /DNA_ID=CAMNT_0025975335 /DNA_START=28 /DNA_END=321 /DNA_ORIENTATION=+
MTEQSTGRGTMFREWEAANRRYQEEKVEITADDDIDIDPLGSPGNSSVADGSLAGWSVNVGAGIVDRGNTYGPFDVEEDYDDDDETTATTTDDDSAVG